MRYILISLVSLLFLASCGDKNKADVPYIQDSSGAINNVSVVTENEIWDGRVGEAIRTVLGKPIYGLPQDEPMFSISQIPPAVFSGFVTKNRTVLMVKLNAEPGIKFLEDVYAKPQKVIQVFGETREDVIEILQENESKIIEIFRGAEMTERLRQMAKSPHTFNEIKEKLKLTVEFPSVYRVAKSTDDFFWIRKDITTGTTNLMIYELPYDAITRNDSVVNQIIKIRDSIGQVYIKGRRDGEFRATGEKIDSYMLTENAYTPFHGKTIVDNKPALETKGLWDLKADFMGGPFIHYAIEDKINKRWVVLEGFAFAPSVDKRNYMLELEAIIKSVKIQ